jgi:hypothetical protein
MTLSRADIHPWKTLPSIVQINIIAYRTLTEPAQALPSAVSYHVIR